MVAAVIWNWSAMVEKSNSEGLPNGIMNRITLPGNALTPMGHVEKLARCKSSLHGFYCNVVKTMGTLRTFDGTQLYFKDWGEGQPVVFSHSWPLCSDAWDVQLRFMADNGFRAIAHDRRGHGRSSQSWRGNDYNTYADDLAQLIDYLDLQDVILVGHCMGGGEVVRYLARHGTSRVSKVVLASAVPPLMLKRMGQPNGIPMAVF